MNIWPLLVGRIAVRDARADLVLIEVKPRPDDRRRRRRRNSCRGCSASAPRPRHARQPRRSSRRTAGAWSSTTSAAPASSATRSIRDLRRQHHLRRAAGARDRRAARGGSDQAARRSHRAHDHRRPAQLARRCELRWRPRQTTADRRSCRSRSAPTCAASCSTLSSNFHWTGKADVHNFDLRAFGGGSALGIITGPLDIGGEMNAFHARGPLHGAGPRRRAVRPRVRGQLRRPRRECHALRSHAPAPPAATSKARARSRPPRTAPNYCCTATGADCAGRWPRASPRRLRRSSRAPRASIASKGCGPTRSRPAAICSSRSSIPMTVAMRGALHKDHLQIDELDLGAFGGNAQLAGEARWSPDESWALAGQRQGIQSRANCGPGFNGALDFDLKASGAPFGGDGELDFAFSNLTGKLRGNAATGSGRVVLQRRGLDFRRDCASAPATPAWPSMASSARRARSTSTSASTPTTSRCSPKARAASCTRAARSAARPRRRSSSSPRRAPASKPSTISVDKLAANIDLDWRGQRTSHADIADHAARSRRTLAHAVQRDARWHDRGSHASGRTRSPARPACTCPARAASPTACGEERSATCSSTTPPTSTCSSIRRSTLMASAEGVQARCAVPARQGRAAVRRGGVERQPAGPRAPMRTICRSAR